MEVLFNTHKQETVSREVSRLCSLLLAQESEHREKIRREVLELYKKRTRIVHYGQTQDVSHQDVLVLRQYVREAIKEMLARNLDKEELLSSLR